LLFRATALSVIRSRMAGALEATEAMDDDVRDLLRQILIVQQEQAAILKRYLPPLWTRIRFTLFGLFVLMTVVACGWACFIDQVAVPSQRRCHRRRRCRCPPIHRLLSVSPRCEADRCCRIRFRDRRSGWCLRPCDTRVAVRRAGGSLRLTPATRVRAR
jgi:hypothetical protein